MGHHSVTERCKTGSAGDLVEVESHDFNRGSVSNKAFAEAFRENEREEQEFSEELKEAVKKAYGNGLNAGRHSHLSAPASLSEGRPGREQYDGFYAWYAAHGR